MKISLLSNGVFPYVTGGIQKHTLLLAKHLARLNVKIDLIYTCTPVTRVNGEINTYLTKEELKNICTIRVKPYRSQYFPSHYLWSSFRSSKAIYDVLTQREFSDFIYAQGFTGWETIRKKLSGRPLPPIGVNFHGLEMYQKAASIIPKFEQLMFRPFVKWNLKNANYALSLGGNLTSIIKKVAGKNTHVLESANGIDSDWINDNINIYPLNNKLVRFVFVGRYERRKGIQELTAVINDLGDNPWSQFDFVGPIPEYLKLKQKNVRYHGLVKEQDKIQSILYRSDILVCPSYSEGLPTVILEGMACANAIIATDVGAIDSIVSKANGWVIKPGNSEQLKDAILNAKRISTTELNEKKIHSRELVERSFTWERVAENTITNIASAIERKNFL